MTRILCLHTAEIHERTFAGLFAAAAPDAALTQVVRADWLDEARRSGLTPALSAEIGGFLDAQAEAFDAVLCTCSTLGPAVEEKAAERRNLVRIDTPLMRKAARAGGLALVAICLESTREATLALLDAAYREAEAPPNRRLVLCAKAWAHFERGDVERFAAEIAAAVRAAAEAEDLGCVVLAQASMAVAEPLLGDLGVPVYSSPRLAVEEALRVASAT